jgi:hypothetical protein
MSPSQQLDVVVLVPFQPYTGYAVEPWFRQSFGSHFYPAMFRGYSAFVRFLGRDVMPSDRNRALFGPESAPIHIASHRSQTAVVLATHLERARLRWKVLDPGVRELQYWKTELEALREARPRCVGISTTFIMSSAWLRALCATIRTILPDSRILLGGAYYLSDAADFLAKDADVFCIGEGESRIGDIVKAIDDEAALEKIPGLCLRRQDGRLRWTGAPPSVPLDSFPPPDWSLVNRIDPPRSAETDFLEIGMETQRGCVFQCEFCTYRTSIRPQYADVDAAVETILGTRIARRALIRLIDSTATFPPKRWEALLRRLVDRGGSPHPIWAFARVSDIGEETAALMAKAGVRTVFIGQESGDQRVLDLMRKGTSVGQVKPALRALQRHGIWAFMGFIHGFPGETAESIRNTRGMIESLNEDFPADRPAVAWYNAYPFMAQDFAGVVADRHGQGLGDHYLRPRVGDDDSNQRIAEEMLLTMMAASRVPHAPVFGNTLTLLASQPGGAVDPEASVAMSPHRYEFQRWLKAVERGTVIFMERDLEGKAPDLAELRRLRDSILKLYPQPPSLGQRLATQLSHRIGPTLGQIIRREWTREEGGGVGLLTRIGLAQAARRDFGGLRPAMQTWRTRQYLPGGEDGAARAEARRAAAEVVVELLPAADRRRRQAAAIHG